MPYEITTFPCSTGGFMRWARLEGPKPSRGCVIIHIGWGEWLEKYAADAEKWRRRGFETVVLERRGQALSSRFLENRNKAWLPDYSRLVEDFDEFFRQIFDDEHEPLLLCGHSMGAHLLLRWMLEKRPRVAIKGVILLSPMQRILTPPFSYSMARLITAVAMMLGLSRHYAPGQESFDPVKTPFAGNFITHDEARYDAMVLALRENPLLKSGGVTFGWLQAAFRSAEKLEKLLLLGAPRGPYLMLGAENDPL
ncbi:MAG: alpha/beta hydrolase, partial [Proteobacteria bacterium]|nr:alpha/beta hydrolase [Pseudomonadota bacterium]